jgi:hypothetical protein
MGSVVVERHSGEVGISKLVVSHIGAVDLKLELILRITDHPDRRSIRRRQVLHGVVEVHLLNLVTRGDRLLDLGHDHVLGRPREHLTLLGIEVRIVGVDLPLARSSLGTPCDAKLDIMVLEGDEGESRLPVLTEGEAERVELGSAGTIVEAGGHRLGGRERREGGGDEGRVGGVLLVNDLTTDEKLNLRDHISPVACECVGRETITRDGHEIDIVEHVTLALEADGGHTVVGDVALNDLTLDSLGKVRVTLVGRTEKADLGLTDEMHILSTDRDKLGNTTRHFILYGDFIFKWEKSVGLLFDTREVLQALIGMEDELRRTGEIRGRTGTSPTDLELRHSQELLYELPELRSSPSRLGVLYIFPG